MDRDTEESALCRKHDPELWFPELSPGKRSKKKKPKVVLEAVTICEQCPIRAQCLEFALQQRMDYGIWGGLTEAQRRKLTRPRASRAQSTSTPKPKPQARSKDPRFTSEVRGVMWSNVRLRWHVKIPHEGRKVWVGTYECKNQAEAAALAAHAELGTSPRRNAKVAA